MKIEPRQLRDVLAIADHGSFTKAAKVLNISQPALSASIRKFEQAVGVKLFERDRRGASLTAYGRLLTGYAQGIDSLVSRAVDDIKLRKDGQQGELTIGVAPIAAASMVAQVISRLIAETPNVSITIVEAGDDTLVQHLRSGRIDFMIAPLGVGTSEPDLEEISLVNDRFCIIMRPQHRLASRKFLMLRQLGSELWVMPEIGMASRRQMETLFGIAGMAWPTRYVTTNSIVAIKSIVAQLDCVSMISRRLVVAECKARQLVGVPLRGPLLLRAIGIRKRRNVVLPPLADRFANALKAQASASKGEPST